MGKRKNDEDDDGSGEDDLPELVNVDFEFFDPAQIDYLALKRLLAQLFGWDAPRLHTEQLAELIITPPLLGSTVKTDGIESDPYGILSVVNMNIHKDHPSIAAIVSYLFEKAAGNSSATAAFEKLLSPEALSAPTGHTGLIISERLANMPPQIMPPMYKMLGDEMKLAVEQTKPYRFDNYVVFSRCFRFTDEEENDVGTSKVTKKQKRQGGGVRSYHAEDQFIEEICTIRIDYEYSDKPPRDLDSFGADLAGRVVVFPHSRFSELVSLLDAGFPARQA